MALPYAIEQRTSADVSVTNGESPDPVANGQPLSYTVVVRNNGPSRAWGVTATEVLPPGVDLLDVPSFSGLESIDIPADLRTAGS